MKLRFLRVDQVVAARDDIAASAALVHGALSSIEELAGVAGGYRVDDIAEAMGWAPRSVQRALAQLAEVGLVELVGADDGRVRRYRTGSAPHTAGNVDTSPPRTAGKFSPRTARISARSAPRTADTSAPQMVEMRAAHGADLTAVPSSEEDRSDPYTGSAPALAIDPSAWLARFDRAIPGELGRLGEHIRKAVSAAQLAHDGPPVALDTGVRWLRFAEDVLEIASAKSLPLADVIERVAEGWASDAWAKREGWPITALVGDHRKPGNPGKYFSAQARGPTAPSKFIRPLAAARDLKLEDDWKPSDTAGAAE